MLKKSERKKVFRAQLSLKSDDLAKLKPGVYSQKIIVKANRSSKKGSKPYRIQRWSYLQVGKSGIRPLTMEQYSAITDPSIIDVDHFGREATVNVGLSEKLEITLDKTKGTAAIPLGRMGGLQQETPLKYKQEKKLREEENERYEN